MMGYRSRVTSVAIVGLLLVMLTTEAASQPPTVTEPPLVIEGRVLWIDFGTQTLALAPANGSPAIAIDLRRLRQNDYHGFRGNEYVRVVGFILRPSRRIQAFELYLVSPWYPREPQSP
jgi:hypothetical protein